MNPSSQAVRGEFVSALLAAAAAPQVLRVEGLGRVRNVAVVEVIPKFDAVAVFVGLEVVMTVLHAPVRWPTLGAVLPVVRWSLVKAGWA